ncbi:MAG: hypothetical protein ACXVI5_06005 [Halobacteriota archaeon]
MDIAIIAAHTLPAIIAAHTLPAWYKEWFNAIWAGVAAGLAAGYFTVAGTLLAIFVF